MGSFGNFGLGGNVGSQGTPGDKRVGSRSESRFKNLLNNQGNEDGAQKTLEKKPSIPSLSRVNENESWRPQERAEPATEPLEGSEEDLPSGSAALAADAEISPPNPRQGYRGFGTPSRQGAQDDFGFGAFGMTTDNTPGFGQGFLPGRDAFQQTPAHQRTGQQGGGGNEPMSPTDTNPYQSPEQHGVDRMADQSEDQNNDVPNNHLPGLGQFGMDPSAQLGGLGGLGALPNLGRNPGGPASDRSQTSSVGPGRAFSGLGGLGQLGNVSGSAAWPMSQGGLGTPGRQTAGLAHAFGGGLFSNHMGDGHAPSLAGLGGGNLFNPQGGTYGAGSRMVNMFPPQMQDQMRDAQHDRDGSRDRAIQHFGGLGDFGRSAESPFANQGFNDAQSGKLQQDASESQQQQDHSQGHGLHQPSENSMSNQPPAPQQRTMVMPDRMRWIYRDPQGQTQGPWSGLEMHDWYKAGFFSPELLVKKYEDPDYEPLAQLIRRIGNSREPFLVPQIGIPYGSSTSAAPNAWAGSIGGPAPGPAQPPFASSFPSFGTTLTAEQQNALERRKQEEQYLMARQKEHLAQAQIAQRMQLQGGHGGMGLPGQLHHHSSAHSLQSQPSFGSITSPAAYQQSPSQGPTIGAQSGPHSQGFFDNAFRTPQAGGPGAIGAAPSLGHIREEEIPGIMDRLNLTGSRQQAGQFGAPGQPVTSQQQAQQPARQDEPGHEHEGKIQQMMQDRARLQEEQAEHDAQQQDKDDEKAQASKERMEQFRQFQGQVTTQPTKEARAQAVQEKGNFAQPQAGDVSSSKPAAVPQQEPLSLTEQVQKAASAKHSPAPQQPGLPQPFPPAPSQSPLPAPAAQRAGRQSVADQLQTDSRGLSQSPSVETPSATVAPWAKEPVEAPRGPSLKEIQEIEARKAAEAEEQAAAARRAAAQKEMEAHAAAAVPAPGIPSSATWGAPSPATPTGSATAAWAKTAQKPAGPATSKTLAQIQKEEEARKRRAAAANAQAQAHANAMSAVATAAGVKSYANLAGKVGPQPAAGPVVGGVWTTVGASGKTKAPGPVPPPTTRPASSTIVPTISAPVAPRSKVAARGAAVINPGGVNAQDEFKKWAVNELRPDLNKGINGEYFDHTSTAAMMLTLFAAENFVANLMDLPADNELITEAVHGVSSTIDSRHFAEEFIRRKRLADKGLVDNIIPKSGSPANGVSGGAGGWSEVAKKGPSKEQPKEEANGNFRVVPGKKRAGKR
jgi:PERQ amino acid-rich with GYF domain-containing protein